MVHTIDVLVQFLAALLSIRLPSNAPRKTLKDVSGMCAPVPARGFLAPGFALTQSGHHDPLGSE